MLTDCRNRPALLFALRVYAALMGPMALLSLAPPAWIGGVSAWILFWLMWAGIMAALVGVMAWIADMPFARRLHDRGWDGPPALLLLIGTCGIGTAMFAAWLSESTLTYLAAFVLTGAVALHQQALSKKEGGAETPAGFPSARLVA